LSVSMLSQCFYCGAKDPDCAFSPLKTEVPQALSVHEKVLARTVHSQPREALNPPRSDSLPKP